MWTKLLQKRRVLFITATSTGFLLSGAASWLVAAGGKSGSLRVRHVWHRRGDLDHRADEQVAARPEEHPVC